MGAGGLTPYYDQDGITIYHGDCREVLPHISGVAVVVTSPPYNTLDFGEPSGMWAKVSGGRGFVDAVRENGYPDDMDEEQYQQQQIEIAELLATATTPDGSLFYNHKCRWRNGAILHPVIWMQPPSWQLREEIIWSRGRSMTLNARMFAPSDERILWFDKGRHKWNQPAGSALLSVWNIGVVQRKPHPVSFPDALPARCIAATTDPGDMILDPFMGAGTTLVAAKQLGRKAIGIEIEEKYCEIAAQRLAQSVLDFGAGERG